MPRLIAPLPEAGKVSELTAPAHKAHSVDGVVEFRIRDIGLAAGDDVHVELFVDTGIVQGVADEKDVVLEPLKECGVGRLVEIRRRDLCFGLPGWGECVDGSG